MTPAQAALLRAQLRLVERLGELEARLAAGDEDQWPAYCQAAAALAAIAPGTAPEARGQMLTTAELAERLQLSAKTVLRRAKRGELQPVRLGARGRGALRWPAAGAGR